MAPRRAVEYILSLELPPEEAACIIERDVRRKSCVQVAMENTSNQAVNFANSNLTVERIA